MVAISDLLGGSWPKRARNAAMVLSGAPEAADDAPRIQLLADIRGLFHEEKTDRLCSSRIATALEGMEDRPWPEWRRGKAITARQVAALLQPFDIRPRKIRFGETTSQGYSLEQFEDAFDRYLPVDPEHSEQAASRGPRNANGHPEQGENVPDAGSQENQLQLRPVPDVPNERPGPRGNELSHEGLSIARSTQGSDFGPETLRRPFETAQDNGWEPVGGSDS